MKSPTLEPRAIRAKVGDNVRALRLGLGQSQEEFCATVGLCQSRISRIECGHSSLRADDIAKICLALRVNAGVLLEGVVS
ncbi:helix-turn-helix domain-containing protein [Engelhardtia mirabilis]|uniref:Helix-turn-helix domain protein n=1 Tax=Engelhardtia mirabilis TaxID=2528011 RepID=A0A518BL19_9BACT|nr:Helix-turn-helix domain protein [Planctomycetes bacterium Pla133]QDV01997.1 Helix-turn-helix domain protein [Planctomycetes bacterium Pla86]